MKKIRIISDLDCVIENYSPSIILRCGENYIDSPHEVITLVFNSIEFPNLRITQTFHPIDISASLNFTHYLRKEHQRIKGLLKIRSKNDYHAFGLYDTTSQRVVCPPIYNNIGNVGFSFDGNFIEVQSQDSYKYGILNSKGEEIFPCQFESINYISDDGFTVVKTNRGKTVLNLNDGIIMPVKDDDYYGFSYRDGLLEITKDSGRGYINHFGQFVFDPIFDIDKPLWAMAYFENGYCWERKNGKWGIIDNQGNITCDFIFDNPGSRFDSNKVSQIIINNRLYFIHPDGKLETRIGNGWNQMSESIYGVKEGTKWGFKNYRGDNMYFDPIFDGINGFCEGICLVTYQGKEGYVNKAGKFFDLSQYKNHSRFSCERSKVVKEINGIPKAGYIDSWGNLVCDLVYDEYSSLNFKNGIARVGQVVKRNRTNVCYIHEFYIDINGGKIIDYDF